MTELDTLLIQTQGQIRIENGQFLVSPDLAKTHSDQIRRFKADICISLGFCLVCLGELVCKVEEMEDGNRRTGRHIHCQIEWHYTEWKF
jgi:hypothetical protein